MFCISRVEGGGKNRIGKRARTNSKSGKTLISSRGPEVALVRKTPMSRHREHLCAANYLDEQCIRSAFTDLTTLILIRRPKHALSFMHKEIGRMMEEDDTGKRQCFVGKRPWSSTVEDAYIRHNLLEKSEASQADIAKYHTSLNNLSKVVPNLHLLKRGRLLQKRR